jgi:hypothetical protein
MRAGSAALLQVFFHYGLKMNRPIVKNEKAVVGSVDFSKGIFELSVR